MPDEVPPDQNRVEYVSKLRKLARVAEPLFNDTLALRKKGAVLGHDINLVDSDLVRAHPDIVADDVAKANLLFDGIVAYIEANPDQFRGVLRLAQGR